MSWAAWVASGVALAVAVLGVAVPGSAQSIDPSDVRAAALAAGLDTLAAAPVPMPDLRAAGVLNSDTPNADRTLLRLGKALFWDQRIGPDGQACASCHFHAGADSRVKNQLNPKTGGAVPDPVFGNPAIAGVPGFPAFGPNHALAGTDFPFHVLADPGAVDFGGRVILRDTNDVASSQGAFGSGADDIFQVAGVRTRRVGERNAPTVINAVFNRANRWDGGAHGIFNGASVAGPLDAAATVLVDEGGVLSEEVFALADASLASQAVGPPFGREEAAANLEVFASLGKRALKRRPLHRQLVHPRDSVLGQLARSRIAGDSVAAGRGLRVSYETLIRRAFAPKYWRSETTITFDADGTRDVDRSSPDPTRTFRQIEANFTLFFGLAVQRYQASLVSDRSPFDAFMAGDDAALDDEQLRGLLTFIGPGNCVSCHGGPAFTRAAVADAASDGAPDLIRLGPAAELAGGALAVGDREVLSDTGFSNTGVRPTDEDLGRGGEAMGWPLAYARQALAGGDSVLPAGAALPCVAADCPSRARVDGAFKVPGLRNVELTGPYFHNGGQAILAQVIEFYTRHGDFGAANIEDLDAEMALVEIAEADRRPLLAFLLALTDERVRKERAPFDHPQLFVPHGHPGEQDLITCVDEESGRRACDDLLEIPAVGAGGRRPAKLAPLANFLGAASTPGPGLDHYDFTAGRTPGPVGIQVAFKLDPSITGGGYFGARYVSPPVFTTVRRSGSTLTVEARAQRAGAVGGSLGVTARWTPADPALVQVSPRRGRDVTLTLHCGDESGLRVASQGAVRQLQIRPICRGGTVQAQIGQ